ncbi:MULTISPECIES: hypothetical protein [Betaproteobacteria]|jgi:hypothetical protein|uniref:Uncharacterized protein n=1 Tax=Crenobacter luteus TaxID=1452487 RepID=A0A165F5G7_9NEIS|nr:MULTISPECIES: hypothetical protein [Betaproteobacteria]KZE31458.1 hypothetical protein AVW16_11825 [Crenobacter luteus]
MSERPQRRRPTAPLRYRDLDAYCDSLERTGLVRVILKANRRRGYALSVEDAGDLRRVIDDHGRQLWFRTVDEALEELANVPYLHDAFLVDRSCW